MRERKSLEIMLKITVFLITFSLCAPAVGEIIYVDAGAVGVNDGSSWENAYIFLQEALADANSADKPVEIRVAQGIYRPDQGLIAISELDWRTTSFQLISGVTLKGGYAGIVEPDPDARDVRGYETILSGDLAGNDVQVADSNDLLDEPTRSENSYNVVTCIDTDETAVLDGFTITAGNANLPYLPIPPYRPGESVRESQGAGMYIHSSNPTLTHCIFTGNSAADSGGGISNRFGRSGSLTLTDCTFIGNSAGAGGGMSNQWYSSAILNNCNFIANEARYWGGAMYSFHRSKSTANNCTFIGNSAEIGGGIYNEQHTELILTNCTLTGNSARRNGNGIVCSSLSHFPNEVELTNCIFWNDGDEIWNENGSTITISYSNIQRGPAGVYDPFETVIRGEGNIDAEPLFVDPNGPDNIPGTEDDDFRLAFLSPCVDSGDPDYLPGPNETDLDGNPRIVSGRIDMGAYEFQVSIYYVDDDAFGDLKNGTRQHPFKFIQEAINVAKDGDTILVLPGEYDKIDFKGKAITVAGTEGAAVIEGHSGRGSTMNQDAVTFHTGEGPDSVLKNFIISVYGMAISLNYGSSPTIRNITIVNNRFGIAAYENSNPDISNCIFWNNEDGDLFQCEARYSRLEGEAQGQGNINVNPLFVDAANGDYHLKSEGWRWNTGGGSWFWDNVTSQCIDAGDPGLPLGYEPMSVPRDPYNLYGVNRRINMGAFGGTSQASMPPPGWVLPEYDTIAPEPNPAQWAPEGAPREVYGGTGTFDYWVEMTAVETTDEYGFVEYFFECTTNSDFNSGWQSSRTYNVLVGRSGQGLRFHVKARDIYGNETEWSEELPAD